MVRQSGYVIFWALVLATAFLEKVRQSGHIHVWGRGSRNGMCVKTGRMFPTSGNFHEALFEGGREDLFCVASKGETEDSE